MIHLANIKPDLPSINSAKPQAYCTHHRLCVEYLPLVFTLGQGFLLEKQSVKYNWLIKFVTFLNATVFKRSGLIYVCGDRAF